MLSNSSGWAGPIPKHEPPSHIRDARLAPLGAGKRTRGGSFGLTGLTLTRHRSLADAGSLSEGMGACRASPALVSPPGPPLRRRPYQIRNPQEGKPIPPRSLDRAR